MDKWNIENSDLKKVKIIKQLRIGFAILLAIAGSVLLSSVLLPYYKSKRQVDSFSRAQDQLLSPLPESQKRIINDEVAYYDPSHSYWENLTRATGNIYADSSKYYDNATHTYKDIVIDTEYSTPMKLSIPAIGIESINLQPNVLSTDETVYNSVLRNGLAHFKGTPLPGDGGNSFIYGHSALPSFFNSHQNTPETIFSKLPDANIGNKVIIERDGKTYQYIIKQKKIVEATDFSVLEPVDGKETVTLMTCWPLGVGTKRLIVIAEKNG